MAMRPYVRMHNGVARIVYEIVGLHGSAWAAYDGLWHVVGYNFNHLNAAFFHGNCMDHWAILIILPSPGPSGMQVIYLG